MKLTVLFDPHTGHYTRDSEAMGWVDDIIHTAFNRSKLPEMDVIVGTALIIHCFRLRLAQGVIKPEWIEFQFGDTVLDHNKYAQIKEWPKGFCDHTENVMMEILEIGVLSAKKKRGVSKFPKKKDV